MGFNGFMLSLIDSGWICSDTGWIDGCQGSLDAKDVRGEGEESAL